MKYISAILYAVTALTWAALAYPALAVGFLVGLVATGARVGFVLAVDFDEVLNRWAARIKRP